MNDSLTRTAMQISAGMIEKEYFRERAAFSDYKMKNREMWELVVAGGVLLVLGIAGYLIRQQIRLHKERKERYWWLVQEMQCKYRELVAVIQQKCHTEIRLKGVIASRFDIVNRLGKTLYERENTALGQTAIVRQVKQLVDSFAENGEMLQELEQIVNMAKIEKRLPEHERCRHAFAVLYLRWIFSSGHQPFYARQCCKYICTKITFESPYKSF